jgi:uncharacterized protein YbbK (DUF523 family)
LVVSQCLLGCRCRYDGKVIPSPAVLGLVERCEFVPVCPELGIGLTVPRPRIRLVRSGKGIRVIQAETGTDLTSRTMDFSAKFLARCKPAGFILKARSPSCGVGDAAVYDACGRLTREEHSGLFSATVRVRFPGQPVVNEEQLESAALRRRFLTSVGV